MTMSRRLWIGIPLSLFGLAIVVTVLRPVIVAAAAPTQMVYLPIILHQATPTPACATGQTYSQGPVLQFDTDNPVRPAWNHADKNFALRGYTSDNGHTKNLVAIGGSTDANAPQLGSLVSPARRMTWTSVRSTYNWNWGVPPTPGARSTEVSSPDVTVGGLQVSANEMIYTPLSGYDLGAGVRAIVLYAASNRITLHYTRQDSGYPGYTIRLENVCVDPNLLALYNSLDNTARNTYYGSPDGNTDYNLPTLTSNQAIGRALTTEILVALTDSGSFMDPRSCKDWWKNWWNGSTGSPVCY